MRSGHLCAGLKKFLFRVRFTKDSKARFLSHRELITVLERTVRRADIPIAYSEGFNPRPRLSFPTALSLGIASDDEIMYMHFAEWLSPAEIMAKLNAALTRLDGIRITKIEPASDTQNGFHVEYQLTPASQIAPLTSQINHLMASKDITVTRAHPDGSKNINLRPYIEDITQKDNDIYLKLKITNQGTARPAEIIEALGLKTDAVTVRKTRTMI
ncbi:MAG: DUF2344 domain-containing protein [Planctomycetes bacterium]|nr:DUF2344 domain-containing protein [Planctomycetota bacterium]